MKTIERKVYVAFDKTEFESAAECRAHERDNAPAMLVGLTAERIAAAIDRSDPDLAEAIERTAYLIANARKAAGDLKRRRSPAEAGDGAAAETADPQPGAPAGDQPEEPNAAL